MTTTRKPIVHVVGDYVPTCTGIDGVNEAQYFDQLFLKSNSAAGATTTFVSKSRQRKFTLEYISRMMVTGDVVVLLNPEIKLRSSSFHANYQSLVRVASEKVGKGRTVLAMQNNEVRKRLNLSSQCQLWQIDYAPVFIHKDGREVVTLREAVPEEAMAIVAKILHGENPDVYL